MVSPKIRKGKKKWITLVGPKLFDNKELGESYCYDPTSLINRKLKVSLVSITNDPKKQNINICFRINEIKDDRANVELVGYEISPVHIRRITKKSKMKLDDSFVGITKDGIKVRVKPMVLTKSNVFNSVATAIRKSMNLCVLGYMKKNTYEKFVNGILNQELQREMKGVVKKIYPVTSCLIKSFNTEFNK